MKRPISLVAAALLAVGSAAAPSMAGGPVFGAPAAASPVCLPGFATIQQLNWLLRCRAVVPAAQAAATAAQAANANCNPNRYWNYGPNVTTTYGRSTATVEYICGHVEG
ncbi:MAG: hypothetical protein AB7O56_00900 [Bauldia sp.]